MSYSPPHKFYIFIIIYIIFLYFVPISYSYKGNINNTYQLINNSNISLLISHLDNKDYDIRKYSKIKIISIGQDAIPFLGKALLGKNEDIACSSARILGELGIAGLPPLIRFLKNPKYRFVFLPRDTSVLNALGRIGPEVIPSVMGVCVFQNRYHNLTNHFMELISSFGTAATPYLLKSLKNHNPVIRHLALLILKKIRDPSVIPEVVRLLDDNNDAVKIEAGWTLGFLGSNAKSALPALIRALRKADSKIPALKEPLSEFCYGSLKSEILGAITRIDNQRDIVSNDVVLLLDDNDASVRKLALVYLQNAKKKFLQTHLSKIIQKVEDPNADVRAEAAKLLGKLNNGSNEIKTALMGAMNDPFGTVRKEALEAIIRNGNRANYALDAVLRSLHDKDPIVQIKALSSINNFRNRSALFLPILFQKAGAKNPEVRRQAITTLGRLQSPDETVIKLLIHHLDDKNVDVRTASVRAVHKIGAPAFAAIPELKKIILSDFQSLRNPSFSALQSIGFKSSQVLIELLQNKSSDIRAQAAKTIGNIQPKVQKAIPLLTDLLLTDENSKVRQAAAISLGQIGNVVSQAIPIICDALEHDYEALPSALQAIRTIGPKARCAIPKLIKLLNDRNRSIRKDAISTIGFFGVEAKGAVPILINIVKSKDPYCTTQAIVSLGQIGPASAPAVPVLRNILRTGDDRYLGNSIHTLGNLGVKSVSALPDIIRIMKDNPEQRENCVEALVQIATDAQDKNATNLIGNIKQIYVSLSKYPGFASSRYEKGEDLKLVKRAEEYLTLLTVKPLYKRMLLILHEIPSSLIVIMVILTLYVISIIFIFVIFLISPNSIIKIQKWGKDIRFIKAFNIPLNKFLLLNTWLSNKRTLDSWVKKNLKSARSNFYSRPTVKQREIHINDLPVVVSDDIIENFDVSNLKPSSRKEIFCLLIQGEGGSGKTAYSDEIVHLFRLIPSTDSEDNRPVVPKQIGQGAGAKRRWYFGYVPEFLS